MKKLELLISHDIDPYPAETQRTHTNSDFAEKYQELFSSKTEIALAGRIMSIRDQGGLMFVDLFDGSGRVQIIVKKNDIGEEEFKLFSNAVSVSDFMEFKGVPFTTKRGAHSLLTKKWTILTKSLAQVPDEWFGIKDEDDRYRKRYLDMLLNPEVADIVRKRSIFWNSIRSFMLERNFLEVETPILETKTGGAEAKPFITHHNALNINVYLRISHELWHKKLMIAGIPKVFEIGRVFRNEGMSYEHAQDYTHFEFYEAFQDSRKGIPMLIDLYRHAAQSTFGTTKFTINKFELDLSSDWEEYDFNTLMNEKYGFDPREVDVQTVVEVLEKEGVENVASLNKIRGVDLLWKKIRGDIGGPAILTGIPVYMEPLAKKNKADLRVVDRFQILMAGSEVGKAFNELNDPQDQLKRFEEQQKLRDAGDEEAQMADHEFVEALEYGMPPTFGFGVSERLFSFLLGTSIRESQLFPLMRPK